jgi:hypothetical protein
MARRLFVLALLFSATFFLSGAARAQETSADFSGGSMIVDYDNQTCNGALTGAMRYNSSGPSIQYCGVGGITTGLIHHWTLDEDPSGGSFSDSVGSATATINSGTVVGTTGQVGNAILLTTDDDISATAASTSALQGATQLTVTMWAKKTTGASLVNIGNATGANGGVNVSLWDDGNFYCTFSDSAWIEGFYALSDTNWHHLACVYDGTQTGNTNRLKGYVDGSPITFDGYNGTVPAALTSAAQTFYIGPTTCCSWSNGTIDDIRIYDRPLSAQEISDLHADTSGYSWTDF